MQRPPPPPPKNAASGRPKQLYDVILERLSIVLVLASGRLHSGLWGVEAPQGRGKTDV